MAARRAGELTVLAIFVVYSNVTKYSKTRLIQPHTRAGSRDARTARDGQILATLYSPGYGAPLTILAAEDLGDLPGVPWMKWSVEEIGNAAVLRTLEESVTNRNAMKEELCPEGPDA